MRLWVPRAVLPAAGGFGFWTRQPAPARPDPDTRRGATRAPHVLRPAPRIRRLDASASTRQGTVPSGAAARHPKNHLCGVFAPPNGRIAARGV